MKNSTINKIKSLLGMEVKLEQMMLIDGTTTLEADAFEMENEVFIVTEDEQKIPLPIGEYELESGMILVVAVEGIIAEIKEAVVEEFQFIPLATKLAVPPVEAYDPVA